MPVRKLSYFPSALPLETEFVLLAGKAASSRAALKIISKTVLNSRQVWFKGLLAERVRCLRLALKFLFFPLFYLRQNCMSENG